MTPAHPPLWALLSPLSHRSLRLSPPYWHIHSAGGSLLRFPLGQLRWAGDSHVVPRGHDGGTWAEALAGQAEMEAQASRWQGPPLPQPDKALCRTGQEGMRRAWERVRFRRAPHAAQVTEGLSPLPATLEPSTSPPPPPMCPQHWHWPTT